LENKVDLPDSASLVDFLPDCEHIRLSLLTGKGVDAFLRRWEEVLEKRAFTPPADLILVNARHAASLGKAIDSLDRALALGADDEGAELIVEELRFALDYLGEVVGKIDNEDMLDKLFASFCIGK
jgi:tRNA modification GTPase